MANTFHCPSCDRDFTTQTKDEPAVHICTECGVTMRHKLRILKLISKYELEDIMLLVLEAYEHAQEKHRDIASGHEGYAVIQEEVDELWYEVKRDAHDNFAKEALQIAAMGMRFTKDVCKL